MTGLTVVLAVYAFLCYSLARLYLSPVRDHPEPPAGILAITDCPAPSWTTPGLAKGQGSGIVFVLAHGYGGSRRTWADLMPELQKQGFEAVAPCMPGHDASADPTTGFGLKEAEVLTATVDWVRSRYPAERQPRVVLMGISMGGAATWLAAGRGAKVDGVITEGAFARFSEAMPAWFDSIGPGASVFLRPVVWMATRMSGLDPQQINPVEEASRWKGRPALVIQGANDRIILRSQAEQLASAAECPLWLVPQTDHAHCFDCARKEYLDKIVEFARALPKPVIPSSSGRTSR